jgi:hypothetical protein
MIKSKVALRQRVEKHTAGFKLFTEANAGFE